jgi:hypothetical protein
MSLLWFRRSRKNDAKQEPERVADVPVAPRQARVPLKIRGLLLLNLQPSDGLAQIETAPPLGSRARVVDAILAAVPAMRFTGGLGEVTAEDHNMTMDLGTDDPVRAAVATAEGDKGLEMLIALVEQTRWRVYAPRAGVFIEPDTLDLFALPDGSTRGSSA